MRKAEECVDAADRCHAYEMGCMSIEDAIAAVQAALDDATTEATTRERYKDLLAMAIINSKS